MQTYPGGVFHELCHQRRQQATFQAIAQAQHESALRLAGIETALIAQATLEAPQGMAHRADHGPGPGGGHHAAALAHEQGVVQAVAQAPQGVAHRRLGQVEHLGGAGQGALGVDGIEDHEQIEIEARHMHGVYL